MTQVFKSEISWWLFSSVLLLLVGAGAVVLHDGRWLVALALSGPLLLAESCLRAAAYPGPKSEPLLAGNLQPAHSATHHPPGSPVPSFYRPVIRYGKYDSVLVLPAHPAGFPTPLLSA